jgi:DNA-binding transcriptional LysR family regulator
MRLRHIEVFHAVYTCGSITAAAKMLNVSQPSVSKVLAHAEQQLGFALFDRLKGKLIPTQEAEKLITHVTDVYDNINELRRISENLRASDTGLIRIAMAPAFGIDLVPGAIASYLDQHPETSFEIETLHQHQVARALKQSRVDIGIVFDPPSIPGITVDHLASAECVVLAHKSMGFGIKRRLTLEDLDGLPFINLDTRSPLGALVASRMETSNIQFQNVAQVETYQMAKALVAHGAGVSIIDEVTANSTGHKDVIAWKLQPPLHFNIALLHLDNEPLSIVAQRFVEHLKIVVAKFLKA